MYQLSLVVVFTALIAVFNLHVVNSQREACSSVEMRRAMVERELRTAIGCDNYTCGE